MPDRAHIIVRVAYHDRLVLGYGAIAAVLGVVMMARAILLIYGDIFHYHVYAVQAAVFNLWALPITISEVLLIIVGGLCFFEGFRFFRDYRISLAIRTTVIVVFWSYVVPATWNSFTHPDTVLFIVGSLSTHIPLGLPYTVLAWITRQECIRDGVNEAASAEG